MKPETAVFPINIKGNSITLETRLALEEIVLKELSEKLSGLAGKKLRIKEKINPALDTMAVLHFGPDKIIELDLSGQLIETLDEKLNLYKEGFPEEKLPSGFMVNLIDETELELRVEEFVDTGVVTQVGDGIALVSGLKNVESQEVVRFQGGVHGIAFNLLHDSVGCLLLGPEEKIREGTKASRTRQLLRVPVGDALRGRIVNALGNPIDGGPPIETGEFSPVEKIAPGIVKRRPVSEPLHTGIKIIDALVPLGRGQRELVLGDRKIGKTTIAIDAILNQKDTDVVCVYTAIGQKTSSVARVVNLLKQREAIKYTVIVSAFPNEPPAFRYLAPYTACAIAEYFMNKGQHALIIYDDLSKHAATYREISALLKRPIGREAYPGDIFYIHSRLLERSARLRDDLGGGSLTALPIIETLAGDISAFIPTNVISICDGQIFLDSNLFNEGFRPAMDVGLSVSRVGGMAQTPAMKKTAGRLRIDLAQYHEMAQFVKFGAEVDEATLDQLNRGERERELLKQDQQKPLSIGQEIVILYAVTGGHTDEIPVDKLREFETGLFRYVETHYPSVLEVLNAEGIMTEETETLLLEAVLKCKELFLTSSDDITV